MSRVRSSFTKGRLILALLAVAGLLPIAGHGQTRDARRIAGFGSSVAFGTGDENGTEGYTGMLRDMLAPKGWDVLNQSRGGDTTKTLATRWEPDRAPNPNTRFLLPVKQQMPRPGVGSPVGIEQRGTRRHRHGGSNLGVEGDLVVPPSMDRRDDRPAPLLESGIPARRRYPHR